MQILKSTLQPKYGTWSDPGVYPSGAGSSPLPDHPTLDDITGELVVELGCEDLEALINSGNGGNGGNSASAQSRTVVETLVTDPLLDEVNEVITDPLWEVTEVVWRVKAAIPLAAAPGCVLRVTLEVGDFDE